MKKYAILYLTKDDLYQLLDNIENEEEIERLRNKIDKITDSQMRYLATKLGELYCETDYWNTLLDLVERLKEVKE